jgi:hypothetical protein
MGGGCGAGPDHDNNNNRDIKPPDGWFGKAVGIRDYYVDGGKEWIDN